MTTWSWKALVLDADPDFYEPEVVYEFDGGNRKFYRPSKYSHGLYIHTVETPRKVIVGVDGERIGPVDTT